MDEYVALFCPHCGVHLNEVETDDETLVALTPEPGTSVKCGHCGIETDDWNHIVQCRRTLGAVGELRFRQAAERLAALEQELALGTEATRAF